MANSTTVPGLPGGPLETDYPIHLKILPEWMTQNRPGIPAMMPRRSVQHGNGNPHSTAASEAQYLFNGAEGRQASYHSTCDDRECWVMIPADEVTWQAADGGGPGNMNGFSCEMIEDADLWADPGRRDRVITVTADFMGRVAARLNIDKPERHWDFNWVVAGCPAFCETEHPDRHNCPDKLRHTMIGGRLAWDIYADRWFAARTDERKRMGSPEPGPVTPTGPTYAAPDVPAFVAEDVLRGYPSDHPFKNTTAHACLREWTVKTTTPRRQTSSAGSKEVGPPLEAGTRFPGWYIFKSGRRWWVLTKSGTRVTMSDLVERVTVRRE
jgi:hypothetical protein